MPGYTVESVEVVLKRALGWFEALRQLEFSSDHIFINFGGPLGDVYKVTQELHTQGKKFLIDCGYVRGKEEDLRYEWLNKANWWNHGASEEDRQAIFNGCWDKGPTRAEFVFALVDEGFELPVNRKTT